MANWMKKGAKAQQAIAKDDEKAKQRAEQNNKPRRFWVAQDAECKITFLDGKLDEDGALDVPLFHEHQLFLNGSWGNHFTCTQDEEPCPVCADGNDPALVAVMTVIDHSEYKAKNGTVYKDQKKLFVCKKDTLKKLQKKAAKQGGLTFCTFDVSRTGDKSARVGDDFEFDEKHTAAELKKVYKMEDVSPLDYEVAIPYLTAAQLKEMGFGGGTIGGEAPASGAKNKNYADEL